MGCGDWVIYNDVSGTGQWQKIDNSSVLSGVGTGQTVALWEGAGSVTDSETLGNAPITVSGNDTTFAGTIQTTLATIRAAQPYTQWMDVAGTRLGYLQHNATNLVLSADIGDIIIDPNDRVGIGTGAMQSWIGATLQVNTPAVSGKFDMTDISRTTDNWVRLTNPVYSTNGSMGLMLKVFPDSDARQGAGIIASGGSDNAATDLDLFVSQQTIGATTSTSYSALSIKGNTGNVGIGTTSPGAKLDIDNGAVTDVRIRGNQTSDARIGAYNFYNTAASDVVAAISADRDGANDAAALAFDTQIAGGGMTERMRITSTGNVGIGAIPRTISTYKVLDISGSGGAGGYIGLSSGSTQQGELYSHSGGVDLVTLGAKNTRFYNNGSERMRITSAGRVGIGTTNPGAKLELSEVSGGAPTLLTLHQTLLILLQTTLWGLL